MQDGLFYDANDNLLSVVEDVRSEIDVLTGTKAVQFTYDVRNRVTLAQRQVDAFNSAPTGYAYDASGNLISSHTDGQTNDAPGSAGNVRLPESFFDYDKSHRLIRTREARFDIATQAPVGDGFRTTTPVLAANGDIIFVTDDLGRATSFAYDTSGRRVSAWDPLSNRAETAYDANGNVVNETRHERSDLGGPVQVFVRTNTYDSLNRCVCTVDNVGNTNRCFFNSLGQCVKSVDPRGVATFHSFDYLGRLTMTVGDLDGDELPSLAKDFSERAT